VLRPHVLLTSSTGTPFLVPDGFFSHKLFRPFNLTPSFSPLDFCTVVPCFYGGAIDVKFFSQRAFFTTPHLAGTPSIFSLPFPLLFYFTVSFVLPPATSFFRFTLFLLVRAFLSCAPIETPVLSLPPPDYPSVFSYFEASSSSPKYLLHVPRHLDDPRRPFFFSQSSSLLVATGYFAHPSGSSSLGVDEYFFCPVR